MFAVNCNKAFSKGFGELQTQAKQERQFLFFPFKLILHDIVFQKRRNMRFRI